MPIFNVINYVKAAAAQEQGDDEDHHQKWTHYKVVAHCRNARPYATPHAAALNAGGCIASTKAYNGKLPEGETVQRAREPRTRFA